MENKHTQKKKTSITPAILPKEDFVPERIQKEDIVKKIMTLIAPKLENQPGKIIAAQVLTTLKLEKIIGKTITQADATMLKTVKDSILANPTKLQTVLKEHQKRLPKGPRS